MGQRLESVIGGCSYFFSNSRRSLEGSPNAAGGGGGGLRRPLRLPRLLLDAQSPPNGFPGGPVGAVGKFMAYWFHLLEYYVVCQISGQSGLLEKSTIGTLLLCTLGGCARELGLLRPSRILFTLIDVIMARATPSILKLTNKYGHDPLHYPIKAVSYTISQLRHPPFAAYHPTRLLVHRYLR